jgi:hypothetical protein
VRQRQPHRAELREARLWRIEDAARNVQMGHGIAVVQQCTVAPAPNDGGQRPQPRRRPRPPPSRAMRARDCFFSQGESTRGRALKRSSISFAGELGDALGAKALHGKRAHHAAVEHGASVGGGREFGLRSQIAEEAAGKAVARAGGVDDFFQREGRRAEGAMLLLRRFALWKSVAPYSPCLTTSDAWAPSP